MNYFYETPYLSEITEKSHSETVMIFKHSSTCTGSVKLYKKLEELMEKGDWKTPVYLVTVQVYPTLSKNISEIFDIKHESPQIIVLKSGKVLYEAHHNQIDIENLINSRM